MPLSENKKIILLLCLFAGIMLGNIGKWELKGADEPRYAQIAREMLETGSYILPHLNGEAYPDKPPLFFWLIALSAVREGDVTAFGARLPSALAALGVILLTYFFGARLFDPATGLLAAGMLFCCEQFFSTGTSAHFDIILVFWTTLALLLLYTGYTAPGGGKKYVLGAYAAMGGALLTKGPVGLAIPIASMLLFALARKEYGRIKDLRIGTGLLIVAGIAAAWLIPACVSGGPEYTYNILFKQTFGRTVESFAHKEPFYFYLRAFPVDFLPWSLFVPAAALYFWKQRRGNGALLLPLVWFAFTFIMFSLVSGKRNLYLLPLYPAACLLMANFFMDIVRDDRAFAWISGSKLFLAPALLFAAALPVAGIAGIVMLAGDLGPAKNISAGRPLLYAAASFAVWAGAVLWRRRRESPWLRRLPYLIIACVAVLYELWAGVVQPGLVMADPESAFCDTISRIVRPEDKLFATIPPHFFAYYLHRYPIPQVEDVESIRGLMASPEKIYCLARAKDYDKLPAEIKNRIRILEKNTIGHKTIYLLVKEAAVSRPSSSS